MCDSDERNTENKVESASNMEKIVALLFSEK